MENNKISGDFEAPQPTVVAFAQEQVPTMENQNMPSEQQQEIRDTERQEEEDIWSEWRLTVIAATVRIALVDILDLSEVDIPAGGFLYPAVGWG